MNITQLRFFIYVYQLTRMNKTHLISPQKLQNIVLIDITLKLLDTKLERQNILF